MCRPTHLTGADVSGGAAQLTVVGGGLAGVEAAWAACRRGLRVELHEMRPAVGTAVHRSGHLAELVCSNSLKSALLTNASGLLKEEMRRLGSITVPIAQRCSVPAGEALAVDVELFGAEVTDAVPAEDRITLRRGEVAAVPDEPIVIIATGPLTSDAMAASLSAVVGQERLSFYDAVAPTVTLDSLDMDRVFRASRRGRGQSDGAEADQPDGDYLNCPMSRDEYEAFHAALVGAEVADAHLASEQGAQYFESCVPVEVLARRGPRTLAFGPMRPVGLTDPRTGRRPYAAVQLRQENRQGSLWGLVGFQTRLKWSEQRRVFGMIPGLERAEFARYGVMHRNTYVNSPMVIHADTEVRRRPGLFLAGQLTGVEGYMESAAIGIVAGINAARRAQCLPTIVPPSATMLGSLCRHIAESDARIFSPMNSNHGLLPPLDVRPRDRRERGQAYADRALSALDEWIEAHGLIVGYNEEES
ncbi:MAG: methylenetetrahydrofolate--tRNA-(uracil(54)-C(5))-methyltransferase (FADH(2)-oxidizing) TrmFO [Armatimonadetes bacterium]|nr:methylenetetrahydrofolate--tRNA-(uracil(54)-C(5))-methyltransferase (FADH(2)-oxidizing) TrmFO [Armatimonadota bacterium]